MKGESDSTSAPPADAITAKIDGAADFADTIVGGLERMLGKSKPAKPEVTAPRIEAGGASPRADRLLGEIRLNGQELKMLQFIGERGGEIPWDWNKCRPDVKAMIAGMINKGIVREREYVTHAAQAVGQLKLALTDQGRQCLEQSARMVQRRLALI